MTDNRKAGNALVAGSLGALITMAIHPQGGGSLTPAQLAHLSVASAVAHSLAMVSVVLLFLGVCGLARYLSAGDRIGFAGLTVYGFAVVATMIGTAVSGFIVPHILRRMVHDTAANEQTYRIVLDAVFQFNQVFSQIYAVAASITIGMFCLCMLRQRGLGRGLAIYGLVVGSVIAVAVGGGFLRLDVHGESLVVLTQGIWFIGAGAQVRDKPDATA